MSEPDCAIIDQDGSVYYGMLKISGKEINSTFLAFKDEEKALELYTHLVEHQDDWILCCHHLVRYQDEWLVALEYSKNIVTYFRERMARWESSNRNEPEWFNYISEDFGKILRDVACIWAKSNKSIHTQDPVKSIFITNFSGRVKFLPNLNASDQPMEGDIDQLKYLMNYIVNMPFGSVIQNYQKFNMPNELLCFLTQLNFRNLKSMSPAFLLDAPLFWRPVDKFHFIINLDHIMKRGEISVSLFDGCLDRLRKKYSYDWVLVVSQHPVLNSILEHQDFRQSSNYHASVVRYCSNVYRHYNDNTARKISIINIENELSMLLPELYLHLFEGLIFYAKGKNIRYPIFSKSIISENP
ncbi:hypothetical protein ES288_D06G044000v1 [Gossypium darwinii]|uniref:Uncharacterized protein n=1 Tax=Gossypium darwinii TaxID=34276 RepID=A0A5D2C5S9_GOSDA|nr:hypothetical protein ES288_D06G044000v1 [Gossypium darwinii]TYG63614.1 hypothetical protein ES288_D06G044000v1 [Gossypium darwinii]